MGVGDQAADGVEEVVEAEGLFVDGEGPEAPGVVGQIVSGGDDEHRDIREAIDPAPIKGVLALPVSALKVASIALRNPANVGRTVALTLDQFTYGFANARTRDIQAWPGKPWPTS